MEEITFEDVTFQYPDAEFAIFEDFSLSLSGGITTFVGQNGTGKSTLLLLAAGLLSPSRGKVYLQGVDTTQFSDDFERQRYVSFIFQNMEFDTEENVGRLLRVVYENGFHEQRDKGFIDTLIEAFELKPFLLQKPQEISKGELQRTILAFSLLYGSRVIMMDEPIFAMEEHQKYNAMTFLTEFARKKDISIYYSMHEIDISQKYSDYTLLFQKHALPVYGLSSKVLRREYLEKAYEVPLNFLKQKEIMYTSVLKDEEEKRKHYNN